MQLFSDDAESYLLQVLLSLDPGEEAFTKLDQALHLHTPLEEPVVEIVNEMEINDCEVISIMFSIRTKLLVVNSNLNR